MKLTKIILVVLGIAFVVIQFIQPGRNKNGQVSVTDISKVVTIPDSVQVILKNACYDCHSNNTAYPWYSYIQPVGWFLAKDISEAKEMLNFSEFGEYPARRQLNKFDVIADEVSTNGMPLPSYRLLHKNARLNKNEKVLLTNWAQHSEESLSVSN
jgi:hypothetical protein